MARRSKLVSMKLRNLGCIGPEGLEVALDEIVCLVGRNNAGKSTVLRAYELAQGNSSLSEADRCQWTPVGDFPEVELCVHIPEGVENVDERWKQDKDGMKLVRSRWRWQTLAAPPIRQTWDPTASEGEGDWAEDGKAGGADNVFKSRLPQPVRVDALKDASAAHADLMKLIIEPIAADLERLQSTPGSPLQMAISSLVVAAVAPVTQYQDTIDEVAEKVGKEFQGIFPDLNISIRVSMEPPTINAASALAKGSSIRFIEESADTSLTQQGAGSRRAMFWSLLQVRNAIARERKVRDEKKKEIDGLNRRIEKEKTNKKGSNEEKIREYSEQISRIEASVTSEEDLSLPGYILLIDEPENCLHPMAVRAARDQLYALAKDDNWQVMLSTHSPYFINPLEDHTTIIRLERAYKRTTPRTFRTATAIFSPDDKQKLRALLQMDIGLSEMFFGSYPILVEGDTEVAAFIASVLETSDELSAKATIVSAKGKALIAPLVKLLVHFKIDFGVLHDADYPRCRDGRKPPGWKSNGAWTENKKIADAIVSARQSGLTVRHRVSVPDFERRLGAPPAEKDKPILTYLDLSAKPDLRLSINELFHQLLESDFHQPFEGMNSAADPDEITSALRAAVTTWASTNAPDDERYSFEDTAGKTLATNA